MGIHHSGDPGTQFEFLGNKKSIQYTQAFLYNNLRLLRYKKRLVNNNLNVDPYFRLLRYNLSPVMVNLRHQNKNTLNGIRIGETRQIM